MRFKPSQREHRSATRHLCRKPALIKIEGGPTIACTVLDLSAGGAGIGFHEPVILPRQFRLQIAEDLFEAECELRHQNGERAGVMFVSHLAEAFSRFRDPPLAR